MYPSGYPGILTLDGEISCRAKESIANGRNHWDEGGFSSFLYICYSFGSFLRIFHEG